MEELEEQGEVEDLPKASIRARIAAGMTREGLGSA